MQPLRKAFVEHVRSFGPEIRELTLKLEGPPLRYQPGQWVSVSLPVGERPPLSRAYSMAEPEKADGRIVLCFDRVQNGIASSYLFQLKSGDQIDLSGPYGNFVLPESSDKDLLFVARFTGIVPIRCMLLSLRKRRFPTNVILVCGAQRSQDLVYGEELGAMAREEPRLRYLPVVGDHEPSWQGERGTEMSLVHRLLRENPHVLPYVCGVRGMVNEVRAVFTEFGFARREVRCEVYG